MWVACTHNTLTNSAIGLSPFGYAYIMKCLFSQPWRKGFPVHSYNPSFAAANGPGLKQGSLHQNLSSKKNGRVWLWGDGHFTCSSQSHNLPTWVLLLCVPLLSCWSSVCLWSLPVPPKTKRALARTHTHTHYPPSTTTTHTHYCKYLV